MMAQDDLCRSSPSPDRIIIVIIIASKLSDLEIVYMHGIHPKNITNSNSSTQCRGGAPVPARWGGRMGFVYSSIRAFLNFSPTKNSQLKQLEITIYI